MKITKSKAAGKRRLTEAERRERKLKDLAKIQAWAKEARKDPKYREYERKRQNERMAQLREDAEFGRKCRIALELLGQLLRAYWGSEIG